jgi:hypothetical protein
VTAGVARIAIPVAGAPWAFTTGVSQGGQARLLRDPWIPGKLSWFVRCAEGRIQTELFGRAADPMFASVRPAASRTATNCLRLREYFGKNSAAAGIGLIASQAGAAG